MLNNSMIIVPRVHDKITPQQEFFRIGFLELAGFFKIIDDEEFQKKEWGGTFQRCADLLKNSLALEVDVEVIKERL